MSKNERRSNGQMTVSEAGKRGGDRLIAKYGKKHMVELGRRSWEVNQESRSPQFFKEMASSGGKATAATHDHDYYSQLGKRGGEKLKEERGRGYYSQIGKKGAAVRKKLRE